jgi:hypothetical protein
MRRHRPIAGLAAMTIALAATAAEASAADPTCAASARIDVPQPTQAQLAAAGLAKFPVAPLSQRVDLVAPPFSHPTSVTNPLFPISALHSAVINGHVDGKPLKIETTLLPETRIIEWSPGQCVRTLVSQFVAYLGGRIEEVALDLYAQDDAGSVWYFGEDVFNYRDGVVGDTAGTWHAGKEGPAAMIMPAHPQVGGVNRSENIPGLVFEEVTTKQVGLTLHGPRGPVAGGMLGSELHDDGTREDKVFAPGYGEFRSAAGGDLEAMALAVPTDGRPGPVPAELTRLRASADRAYHAATERRWRAAAKAARRAAAAWRAHRTAAVPPRLVAPLTQALARLTHAVTHHRRTLARTAAISTAQAALDLELQYRPPADIDRERFVLWARRAAVDAAARDTAGPYSDISALEWVRDRIMRAVDPVTLVRIDAGLTDLRSQVDDGKLKAAARTARALSQAVTRP